MRNVAVRAAGWALLLGLILGPGSASTPARADRAACDPGRRVVHAAHRWERTSSTPVASAGVVWSAHLREARHPLRHAKIPRRVAGASPRPVAFASAAVRTGPEPRPTVHSPPRTPSFVPARE